MLVHGGAEPPGTRSRSPGSRDTQETGEYEGGGKETHCYSEWDFNSTEQGDKILCALAFICYWISMNVDTFGLFLFPAQLDIYTDVLCRQRVQSKMF